MATGDAGKNPILSIIMACRVGGNSNSKLANCFNYLVRNAADAAHFEILIKLDTDDERIADIQSVIQSLSDRLTIKTIITPRAGGYGDLHKAYLDLLRIANPSSELYWVISDDIEIHGKSWDAKLISHCRDYPDGLYTLNTLLLPELDHVTAQHALEVCDMYPLWSKRWIGLQGGFGYTYSTDGWTNLLCHKLRNDYGVDRRIFVEDIKLRRHTVAGDLKGSERWNGVRREGIEMMLSPQLQYLLDCTARSFVYHLQHHGKYSITPPPPSPRVMYSVPSSQLLKVVGSRLYKRVFRA